MHLRSLLAVNDSSQEIRKFDATCFNVGLCISTGRAELYYIFVQRPSDLGMGFILDFAQTSA